MLSLILAVACSSGPELKGVDPVVANPGQSIALLGDDFADDAEAFLQKGEGAPATAFSFTEVKGPVLVHATVPEGQTPGVYTVGIKQDSGVSTLPGVLTIEAVKADTPCAGEYTANTQLSLARKEVVVDRFYREGERETLKIPLRDIQRVEYELVKMPDGELCSVIFMRKTDGDRVMFDDDKEVDLRERAYKLGQSMGKKVETTRMDAEALAPSE